MMISVQWMASSRLRRMMLTCLLTLAALLATPAQAQSDPAQLLDDFVHYALVAKPDLAVASAQTLMDSGITDAELAELLDEGTLPLDKFDRAVSRALLVPEMSDVAAELAHRIERGRLDLARDKERIDEAITLLTGNQRQKLLAQKRLEAAGEYAVPSLLTHLTESRDEQLKSACEITLRNVGRLAVNPLCAAMPHLGDPTTQRIICDILGDIGYQQAAPFLLQMSQDEAAAESVRDAAYRAFQRVGGADGSLSILYSNLAHQYFQGTASLYAYPYEHFNNVWSYDPYVGLVALPVPTEVFGQIMAMRLASRALELDPANRDALSYFVAANLKRENDLPEGEVDPIYADTQYTPAFYATVFGTDVCLDVLALALDNLDTPLVRDALAALAYTTGGSNLFASHQGRQPLLEALQYPDRRVQYESALTLGRALPRERFAGDVAVVPLLAAAVRSGGESFALVLAEEEEDQRVIADRLDQQGFSVLGSASSVGALEAIIAESSAVDLIVLRYPKLEDTHAVLNNLRVLPQTIAAPVLAISSGADLAALRRDIRSDLRVKAAPWASVEAFETAVDDLLLRAAGGRMEEADAEMYAIEALAVLEDIAVTHSPAYNIADAESALLDAMDQRSGGTRLLVAKILSLINSEQAQQDLFDAALASEESERVELLNNVAASIKQFGSLLQDRQIRSLVRLVAEAKDETAEAAARVHGALNLPTDEAIYLIPS